MGKLLGGQGAGPAEPVEIKTKERLPTGGNKSLHKNALYRMQISIENLK
jgi:hypothetical protein